MKKITLLFSLFLFRCSPFPFDISPDDLRSASISNQTTGYELIIVSGQSNAGDIAFGSEQVNTKTWNVNTFKMSNYFGKNETWGGKIGFLYYLSGKLKTMYPAKNFVFMQYNVRATSLISIGVTAWNPKKSYNLFYNLANHIRDCILVNGIPNSIHFIWVQGENDNLCIANDYLKAETNLYDSLISYSQVDQSLWRYYSYLPKKVGDTTFCNTVIQAKKIHALNNNKIKIFEVAIANYSDIHMITTSGLIVCADTLMKKIVLN